MLDQDFPLITAPELEYLRGGQRSYGDFAAQSAIEAAIQAFRRLEPVRIGLGRRILGDLSFNRRAVSRNGRIIMPKPAGRVRQPFDITELCYLEGPTDPKVGVCCVQPMNMEPTAFLLHFTCHPANVFGDRATYYAVPADWPAA